MKMGILSLHLKIQGDRCSQEYDGGHETGFVVQAQCNSSSESSRAFAIPLDKAGAPVV